MGCWNGTCLISNLPIMGGERAVGYIIQYTGQGIKNSSVCHSSEYAKPISLPIRGEYDDYGGLDNVGYNNLAVELAASGLEVNPGDLVRGLERGNHANQSIVLMHESIHDGLIASMRKQQAKNNYYDALKGITANDIKFHIKSKLNIKKIQNDMANPSKETIAKALEGFDDLTKFISNLGGTAYPYGPDFGGLMELINKDYPDDVPLDHADLDNLINEYVTGANDLKNIGICMDGMRKLWLVPTGSGSQSQNYDLYLVLGELMRKKAFENMTEDGPVGVYRRILEGKDY